MKRLLFAAAVAAATVPAFAADVGVSINVGQPGFYGQINIGDVPRPQLIYQQPIIIQRPVRMVRQPIYLHVPPGHAKHWGKHCRQYNACGRQVYFVQDNWYNEVYVPRYREHYGDRGERHGHGQEYGQEHGRHNDDRGERHRHGQEHGGHNDDRGERHGGKEHGHGNGHDKHDNKD